MRSKPRILITGRGGQVGVELQRSFRKLGEVVAVGRETVNLAEADEMRDLVRRVKPDIVLNAAAYTAVDRAELEPSLAMTINARAVRILAEEAQRSDALFVHYSTNYVFDGQKQSPWTELDEANPLNSYGVSKLAGEAAIKLVGGKYLVFRTSWVYGPRGANFLQTMLRLARKRDQISVIHDQYRSPTTSIEFADATHRIVSGILEGRFGAQENWAGVYHMTCPNSTSWCGFAQRIVTCAGKLLNGKSPLVIPIPSKDYPSLAKRPNNSVLSNAKLEDHFAPQLPRWEIALDAVIQTLS